LRLHKNSAYQRFWKITASIGATALDAVERPLAGAMKKPESFLVGAELRRSLAE
jgi:hypothetical protein